jgi:hypothetical protein
MFFLIAAESTVIMKHILLIFPLIFLVESSIAQANSEAAPGNVQVMHNDVQQKIDVSFGTEKEIANLLVLVTDESGQTVFLENLYRFKGEYKNTIDLKTHGKGNYYLTVKRDDNIFDKQVIIR